MTGDGEEKRLKESLLLLGTIGLLCKQLPPGGAEFAQVLHWTQRLCMEQTPGGVIYCGDSGVGGNRRNLRNRPPKSYQSVLFCFTVLDNAYN